MASVALSLDNKVALITGGSRGIGAETVRLFTAAGARVAFSFRQARERAETLVLDCGGPSRCVAIEQDLTNPADGRALVAGAVRSFGRLDILVVNHGIWPSDDAPIADMTEQQWRGTMSVNLDSVFGLVQAAVAQMDRQERPGPDEACGHIVLISSTAGQRGEAFHADYAVTKGALISLTKSLSTELAPRGIRVNCVAPGWVTTEMSAAALGHPELGPKIAAGIPVGRAGTPREIAGPVLFLCTPWAGFISGEVLNVNGGAVLVG
ncbi:SDR family oxidoreductase [Acidobacteria bacterium AB60]|nr:SDR family oxidoreductase [Acidobacteria bacterium AB60]